MKFNVDKLQDPKGGSTLLHCLSAEEGDTDTVTSRINTAVTETATVIPGKVCLS